jgi:hypothetical protein
MISVVIILSVLCAKHTPAELRLGSYFCLYLLSVCVREAERPLCDSLCKYISQIKSNNNTHCWRKRTNRNLD